MRALSWRTRFLTAVLAVSMSSIPVAQESATLLLTSGERIEGELVDVRNGTVYFRAGWRSESRIPLSSVAMISFDSRGVADADTGYALENWRAGEHLLILRSGRRYRGRFEGLSTQSRAGRAPLELQFRSSNGELIRARSSDVSALMLSSGARGSSPRRAADVTIALADGQTLRGRLADVTRSSVTLNAASRYGGARRVGFDQIAFIDFGGDDVTRGYESWPGSGRQRGANHVLVFRDGREVYGRFLGETTDASVGDVRLLFREQGGRLITFIPADADRLYLAGGTPSGMLQQTGDVVVDGNQPWTPTRIFVNEGELVQFTARGDVQLSTNSSDRANPAGAYTGRQAANGPYPNVPAGALLGRVNGVTFVVGNTERSIRMPATGQLELGINDDHFNDNEGRFAVTVSTTRDRGSLRR